MNINRRWLGVLFPIIIIAAIIIVCGPVHEPEYRGKRLHLWLTICFENDPQYQDVNDPAFLQIQERRARAEEAIRQIGTNAIPVLLRMVRAVDSPNRDRLTKIATQLGFYDKGHGPEYGAYSYMLAETGFDVLGARAKSAVPQLIALLDDTNYGVRRTAAYCLGAIGPQAEEAVPALLRHINDTNEMVQDFSLSSLGKIHKQANLVVPHLIQYLSSYVGGQPSDSRESAIISLGKFGTGATSAVPALLSLCSSSNAALRSAATNSLLQIDPKAIK